MSAERWDRLAASLADAGVQVKVDATPYSEAVYGRVRHGVSRRVRIILEDGRHVTIDDGWWRKNPDIWIGWQVHLEDAEGIGVRSWPVTKKRSEVVAVVVSVVGASGVSAVTK